MRDASTCNLMAKLFLAPPSRVWKKFSPPWSCAVEFRERRWEDLPLTSRIHASLHFSQNSAVFLQNCFLPSRKLPAISALPCVARPSPPVAGRRETTAQRTQADLPRVSRARPPL